MRTARVLLSVAVLCSLMSQATDAEGGTIRRNDEPIAGEYIVVLKGIAEDAVRGSADALAHDHGGEVEHYYQRSLRGFAVRLSEKEALALSRDPRVDFVEENGRIQASGVQIGPANWALDRIDQRFHPLDGLYSYGTTGLGVHAYIVDSGINPNHTEFTGRIVLDRDYVQDAGFGVDCFGHGTAVAGILGGTNYGVAKQVTLHVLKIFDCAGVSDVADTIAAVEWVAALHVKPAVLNLSLNRPCGATGPPCTLDSGLDIAVKGAKQAGVIVVNSAGNGGACDSNGYVESSPALRANPIVVGATLGGGTDRRVGGTCFGGEVDLYAPGWELTTASHNFPTGTVLFSLTSAAAPVVSGAVARYLEMHPTATQGQVEYYLTSTGTPHIVRNIPWYGGSQRNPLLHVQP